METIFIYILKVNALLVMFYLVYQIALSKETFYKHSRWFLLSGIFVSLVLPFVTFTKIEYYEVKQVLNNTIENNLVQISNKVAQEPILTNQEILFLVYGMICFGFLIKTLFDFFKLFKIIKVSNSEKKDKLVYINTNLVQTPFSFFNYIVFNEELINPVELQNIMKHEEAHSMQKRIIMLNTNKSNRKNALKYAIVIPVLVAFIMLFQVKVIAKEKLVYPKVKNWNQETKNSENVMYLINAYSSNKELDDIFKNLKEKHQLEAKYYGVKRNKKSEIIAIKVKIKKNEHLSVIHEVEGDTPIDEFVIQVDTKSNSVKIMNSSDINYVRDNENEDSEKAQIEAIAVPMEIEEMEMPEAPTLDVDFPEAPEAPEMQKAPEAPSNPNDKKAWAKFEKDMDIFEKNMKLKEGDWKKFEKEMKVFEGKMKSLEPKMKKFEKKMKVYEEKIKINEQKTRFVKLVEEKK